MNKISDLENRLAELEKRFIGVERKLAMAGTELSCVGRCGGLARKGSNYCQACMDENILAVVGERASDLPLRTRVAKALGKDPYYHKNAHGKGLGAWCMYNDPEQDHPGNMILVPDYDKHRDLAMGALEEYCRKIKKMWVIKLVHTVSNKESNMEPIPKGYRVVIDYDEDHSEEYPTIPQAICEAIAKHAEAK